MLPALIYLIVELVVLGFLYWVVTQLPFIVEPWRKILLALIVLICAILVVMFLLGLIGLAPHQYRSIL